MPRLRTATPDDAETFAAIFVDCWTISYSQVMPAELVERMTADRARKLWRGALASGDPYAAVEDDQGQVAGFVGYRLNDDGTGYVSSLYVSPFAQGGGYGRLLVTRAEDDLRALGATRARLWVFEQNEPSRRFYEKNGWSLDGTRETLEEWGQPQVGMAKRL
ncbi:GNAT family N-acetyltransferase [Leifsonia sp. AG29]|uniref:GNAT family N-acetyltransferase n=1 Tax=Leifsonia sp. AG29 TaxID=2598860 RepID=UPI00131A8044|nr:GNAT family N-acetyltransferase [Leifsonia sp. AG29]